ncbi:MAG: B12-binding domain-containing radical SAM protein [Promethearchaeota archaeon]
MKISSFTRPVILIRPRIEKMIYEMPNPPIGLGYLSSYLERHGYKCYILDLSILNIEEETLFQFIERKGPLLIGISALTAYYPSLVKLSRNLKSRFPNIPVVLGGVHPSSLPELSLKESKADFTVIGEGELTLLELAQCIDKRGDFGKIDGLAYLVDERLVTTNRRELIRDLDSIPFPSWEKINPLKYPKEPHGFLLKYAKVAPIITTRGCPFQCIYCASSKFWGRRIRYRSAMNVVDEIEYLVKRFGIREIHFWDDNLTMKSSHIIAICREIIKRDLKVALAAPNGIRVDTLNKVVLKWMKRAGFHYLLFAVESGSVKVLKSAKKQTDLKIIARNAFLARDLGFYLNSYFILGFPADTEETMDKTIKLAKSLPLNMWGFFVMKPLPGSEIFDKWSDDRDLFNYDWTELDFYSFKNNVSPLGAKILEKYMNKAYKAVILPKLIQTLYFRFVKYGKLFQLKHFIRRILYFFMGFNKSTIDVEESIK